MLDHERRRKEAIEASLNKQQCDEEGIDDDGLDWFTSATKKRQENEKKTELRKEYLKIQKREERIRELKEKRQNVKVDVSNIYSANNLLVFYARKAWKCHNLGNAV